MEGARRSADADAERREAFRRFTQARMERAYRLATVILRDSVEAQDAVHDAAVQAWTHWSDLREADRLDAWFDRILVNECRARMRRSRTQPVTLIDPIDPADGRAFEGFGRLAERDLLRRGLATLSPDHRLVVVLRYLADLTPAEIAARTGDPEGTVKSRLHYALNGLRASLDAAERTSSGADDPLRGGAR